MRDKADKASLFGKSKCGRYESRRCEILRKKLAETESRIIPFQTYLWERRTLGRPNCQEVY